MSQAHGYHDSEQRFHPLAECGENCEIHQYARDDEVLVIDAGSPEHLASFTVDQLRTLAASTRQEHVMAGYAARLELVRRGEEV